MDVIKIGAFIKTQRTELNMTQKDLAEKLGCTDKAVSLVFFFINLFYLTDEKFLGFIVSLYFAAGSLFVIAIVSLLVYLYKKFKCR